MHHHSSVSTRSAVVAMLLYRYFTEERAIKNDEASLARWKANSKGYQVFWICQDLCTLQLTAAVVTYIRSSQSILQHGLWKGIWAPTPSWGASDNGYQQWESSVFFKHKVPSNNPLECPASMSTGITRIIFSELKVGKRKHEVGKNTKEGLE